MQSFRRVQSEIVGEIIGWFDMELPNTIYERTLDACILKSSDCISTALTLLINNTISACRFYGVQILLYTVSTY